MFSWRFARYRVEGYDNKTGVGSQTFRIAERLVPAPVGRKCLWAMVHRRWNLGLPRRSNRLLPLGGSCEKSPGGHRASNSPGSPCRINGDGVPSRRDFHKFRILSELPCVQRVGVRRRRLRKREQNCCCHRFTWEGAWRISKPYDRIALV